MSSQKFVLIICSDQGQRSISDTMNLPMEVSVFDYSKWFGTHNVVGKPSNGFSILKPKPQSLDGDSTNQDIYLPATAPTSPEIIDLESPPKSENTTEGQTDEVILLS